MKTQKTFVSDATDARRKVAQTRDRAESDGKFAVSAANKIAEHPELLDGLATFVAKLAKNEAAAAILDGVFDGGAAERYPRTYRAYLNARFSGR